MATRRVGSTKSLYDIALGQMRQRAATGQPSLPSGFWSDALYAANLAELESARGEEAREEELAFRREQFEAQKEQSAAAISAQKGAGYAQLAVNAPMTYMAAKQLGLFGATTPAMATTQTAEAGLSATGSQALMASQRGVLDTAIYGAGGAPAYGGGAGVGMTGSQLAIEGYAGPQAGAVGAGAGTSLLAAGGAGAVGGYVGAKYGPFKKESGQMATFGMGGEKEQKSMGGALRGAGAGALAGAAMTSWSGPGAIVGAVVGAIVGFVAESDTVICTELARQGYIDQEYLDFEHRMQWDFATYWGYRILADPFVVKMKTSKTLTLLILPFARAFLKEVAHRVEPKRSGSLLGSLLIKLGVPICRATFFHFADQLAWPAKYKLLEKIQTWKEN